MTSPAVDQPLIEQENVIIRHELTVVSFALVQQLKKNSNAFHLVQVIFYICIRCSKIFSDRTRARVTP